MKAGEAGLYGDAAAALALAEADAARMRAMAAREAESVRAQARMAGEEEGRRAATRKLVETSAGIKREIAGLPVQVAEAIAAAVARVVGGLDLADAVARAAQRALADLAGRHALQVRVAPAMVGSVQTKLAIGGTTVHVIADPTLPDDGCILETEAGFVRATLSEQLTMLRAALVAEARRGVTS